MSEPRILCAHLRMNRAKIFTVTVVGHEITFFSPSDPFDRLPSSGWPIRHFTAQRLT